MAFFNDSNIRERKVYVNVNYSDLTKAQSVGCKVQQVRGLKFLICAMRYARVWIFLIHSPTF